jgi:hypothetical protein
LGADDHPQQTAWSGLVAGRCGDVRSDRVVGDGKTKRDCDRITALPGLEEVEKRKK